MSADDGKGPTTDNARMSMEAAQRGRAFMNAIDHIIERHNFERTEQVSKEIEALFDRAINSGEGDALIEALDAECVNARAAGAFIAATLLVGQLRMAAASRSAGANRSVH